MKLIVVRKLGVDFIFFEKVKVKGILNYIFYVNLVFRVILWFFLKLFGDINLEFIRKMVL